MRCRVRRHDLANLCLSPGRLGRHAASHRWHGVQQQNVQEIQCVFNIALWYHKVCLCFVLVMQQVLADADRAVLEKKIEALIKENSRFERITVSREEALAMFTENKFKVSCMSMCMSCLLQLILSC